jgi:hypothetical protein
MNPVFVSLLLMRILNAVSITTFFEPDEYFQTLEVAHRLAFGYVRNGYAKLQLRRDDVGMEGASTKLRHPFHFLLPLQPPRTHWFRQYRSHRIHPSQQPNERSSSQRHFRASSRARQTF